MVLTPSLVMRRVFLLQTTVPPLVPSRIVSFLPLERSTEVMQAYHTYELSYLLCLFRSSIGIVLTSSPICAFLAIESVYPRRLEQD